MRINYKSDFKAVLRFYDVQREDIGIPEVGWKATFWTQYRSQGYEASMIGGVCKNCRVVDGKVVIIFDHHGLGPGDLNVEIETILPDGAFNDGAQNLFAPDNLDITLIAGPTRLPAIADIEMQLPYIKGENGKDGQDGRDGRDGQDGKQGDPGKDGANGKSAFEIAVEAGYSGTEQDFAKTLSDISSLQLGVDASAEDIQSVAQQVFSTEDSGNTDSLNA